MDFNLIFSEHALQRAQERKINKHTLTEAVRWSDKVDVSSVDANRLLSKKVYFNDYLQRDHLLMIVAERDGNNLRVITIIDTSKINKYL